LQIVFKLNGSLELIKKWIWTLILHHTEPTYDLAKRWKTCHQLRRDFFYFKIRFSIKIFSLHIASSARIRGIDDDQISRDRLIAIYLNKSHTHAQDRATSNLIKVYCVYLIPGLNCRFEYCAIRLLWMFYSDTP